MKTHNVRLTNIQKCRVKIVNKNENLQKVRNQEKKIVTFDSQINVFKLGNLYKLKMKIANQPNQSIFVASNARFAIIPICSRGEIFVTRGQRVFFLIIFLFHKNFERSTT